MSTGASAMGAVSVAFYNALNVASYTGGAGVSPGGLFDHIPQGTTTYPVSWYTVREEPGGGETFSAGGKFVTVRLRAWDGNYEGMQRLQSLMNKAAELLDNSTRAGFTPLTITGWTCPICKYVGAFALPDDEVAGVRVKVIEGIFELTLVQN